MEKSEKEYILKALGEKLKELKNQQKLSYRELAAKCDIDHADLKKYERGVDIKFSTLIELARLYKIHPSDLVDLNYGTDFKE